MRVVDRAGKMDGMQRIELSIDDVCRGYLILVNAKHPLEGVQQMLSGTGLVTIAPDIQLEALTAKMLREAIAAVDGSSEIVPVSGYRSRAVQRALFADALRDHGRVYATTYVAMPGCSEHETGLAIDLGERREVIDFICPAFPYTGVCGAFRSRAVKYGFVERYPEGRTSVTGIGHEPWHFRYVGYPHSQIMMAQQMVLEEYTEYVRGFGVEGAHLNYHDGSRRFEVFHVPMDSGDAEHRIIEIPACVPYVISGNNAGGVVVTIWH